MAIKPCNRPFRSPGRTDAPHPHPTNAGPSPARVHRPRLRNLRRLRCPRPGHRRQLRPLGPGRPVRRGRQRHRHADPLPGRRARRRRRRHPGRPPGRGRLGPGPDRLGLPPGRSPALRRGLGADHLQGAVRRRRPLHRRGLLGRRHGRRGRLPEPARRHPGLGHRQHLPRSLPRPHHRLQLPGQPPGCAAGRLPLRQRRPRQRLERGLGGRSLAGRTRLVRGDAHPLRPDALQARAEHDLGPAGLPLDARPGRGHGLGAVGPRPERLRQPLGQPDRPRGRGQSPQAGGPALRPDPPHRPGGRGRRRPVAAQPADRRGLQVRPDRQHHPQRHHPAGFRPGGGRPRHPEPVAVRDLLPGEAAVLHRGRPLLPASGFQPVLLAAHRHRRPQRAHPRRGQADGQDGRGRVHRRPGRGHRRDHRGLGQQPVRGRQPAGGLRPGAHRARSSPTASTASS